MWSASLDQMFRGKWTAGMGAVAIVLALGLAGCTPSYVTDSSAPVVLSIQEINGGSAVLSDVNSDGTIINCDVEVGVQVTTKNPMDPGTAVEDVTISRYEIHYRRSDGRGQEGIDVPYAVSSNMAFQVPVNGEGTFSIRLVRHAAKILPPLSNISGLEIVTMIADVTLYGETIARQGVSATGSVQIDFADYATGTPTCEGS
jgi:DNA/RNA endonuclease YhcR with UshA esterase domain